MKILTSMETRRPTSQGGWRQEQEGGIQSFEIATAACAKQGEGPEGGKGPPHPAYA